MSISTRLYLIITILVVFWCAGILVAPILKHIGEKELAEASYSFFSRVCHQNDARSFHFEGEKLGVCIRCSSVYFGFLFGLVFMLLFNLLKNSKTVHRSIFIVAVSPMLLDVILNDMGIFTSTTISRVITGVLFGTAMSWLVMPILVEAFLQILHRTRIHTSPTGVLRHVRKTQ